jgi:hypothetical protein
MFKKSTLLALAGALTLGVAMLSPVSADAKGFGGGHGGGFHGGGGMKFHGGGGFKGHGHVHFRPHFRPHWHYGYGYRRHFWVAPAVTYAVARPVAAAPGPCTCLSKEYTPEGAVLFKDRCTSEMAMNPPAAAPQQTSYAPAPVYQTAPVQAQPQQAYVPTYPGPAAAQPAQQ